MRQLTGTEKQIAYANDLINKKVAEIEGFVSRNQPKSMSDIPTYWNTPEKIEAGLAKRAEMNQVIIADIAHATAMIEKLNNLNCSASAVIDGIRLINSRGVCDLGYKINGMKNMGIDF